MAASLENRIQEKVKALPPEKQQRVLSMVEEMLSEKEATQSRVAVRPLCEIAEEISSQVPLEEWGEVTRRWCGAAQPLPLWLAEER